MKFVLLFVLSAASLTFSISTQAAKVNGLGQDYEVYDLGSYSNALPWNIDFSSTSSPPNNNWYWPAHNYLHPIYLYQLYPKRVRSQLSLMRESGIDVLVLHISMAELAACESSGACPTPFNDGIWGYITDVSQSSLRPQQKANLIEIVNRATAIGFRKIVLRFDYAEPGAWTAWNEQSYQKGWNFIADTRSTVATILNNSATRLVVDLGGEQIGIPCSASNPSCQNQAYVQRLWSDYTSAFGTKDTVGFSFIGCGWVVQNGIGWFGSVKPEQYAFDVYGGCTSGSSVQGDLIASWQALGAEKSKEIMIMETYTNDIPTKNSISSALASNPTMNVIDVIQWPITRAQPCNGCDGNIFDSAVSALNSAGQVTNYLSIAASAAVDNRNPALLNIVTTSCQANSSSTCALFNIGYQPIGANNVWQLWVRRDNLQPRTLWGCNAGSQVATNNWMVKGSTYKFEYFKASACNAAPGSVPDAVSYIAFR